MHLPHASRPAVPGVSACLRSAHLQEIEAETAAAGGKRPPIISFSHFLPRQELLPEKASLGSGPASSPSRMASLGGAHLQLHPRSRPAHVLTLRYVLMLQ